MLRQEDTKEFEVASLNRYQFFEILCLNLTTETTSLNHCMANCHDIIT